MALLLKLPGCNVMQALSCMPLRVLPPRPLSPVAADANCDAAAVQPCFMAAAPELGKLQHAKQAVWGLFTEQVSPNVTDCCVCCVSVQECRLLFIIMVVVLAVMCSSLIDDAPAHHLS